MKATAVKRVQSQEVCFDVNLELTEVEQQQAMPSNWTAAWVDQNNQYHLLNLNSRNPASVPTGGKQVMPYGFYRQWHNTFTSCGPLGRGQEVKSLVLTPKSLPYGDQRNLSLNWH